MKATYKERLQDIHEILHYNAFPTNSSMYIVQFVTAL